MSEFGSVKFVDLVRPNPRITWVRLEQMMYQSVPAPWLDEPVKARFDLKFTFKTPDGEEHICESMSEHPDFQRAEHLAYTRLADNVGAVLHKGQNDAD